MGRDPEHESRRGGLHRRVPDVPKRLRPGLVAPAGDRGEEAGVATPRVGVVDGDVLAVQVHLHAVDAFERADRALEGVHAVLAGNFRDGQNFLSHDSLLLVQSPRHRIAGPPQWGPGRNSEAQRQGATSRLTRNWAPMAVIMASKSRPVADALERAHTVDQTMREQTSGPTSNNA